MHLTWKRLRLYNLLHVNEFWFPAKAYINLFAWVYFFPNASGGVTF